MDYRSKFMYWYFNKFQLTELYQNMSNVAEESPWHRERNVGTHTDMVVSQYLVFAPNEWTYEDLLGGLACAFHDVGKPAACEKNGIKFKPERGHYKSFGGHEQISARMWEDWAATNYDQLVNDFLFIPYDIYRVGWIIEKHLPWGIKKADKLHNIALTALELFSENGPRPYTNMLLADTYGRMSDDYIEKRQKVRNWIESFENLVEGVMNTESHHDHLLNQPILYFPIGASGTGKSTFIEKLRKSSLKEFDVFSRDILYMEWYVTDEERSAIRTDGDGMLAYQRVFTRMCDDKEFTQKMNRRFAEIIKTGKDIVVDNTNLSKKVRRFFIDCARRQGYYVIAVLMPVPLQTVIDRQTTRRDKNVPISAVKQQYMSVQLPEYGEVDDVWVINDNL